MFATLVEAIGVPDATPLQAAVVAGLLIGLLFGVLAQTTRFCLRRAIGGDPHERSDAAGVWAMALLTAIAGTQILVASLPLSFAEHRFLNPDMPVAAIIVGGLMFGAGMILTRGCVSRLTVLTGSGNLRALLVVTVFAIVAHATLKGVLAPLRVWLGSFTWSNKLGIVSLADLPAGPWLYTGLACLALLILALRSSASRLSLFGAALLGSLIPLAWLTSGWLLFDDFDPLPLESLSFTLPHTQLAFWLMASSAVAPSFGIGIIGGVVAGSLVMHLARGQFHWQSFESPGQTLRYLAGSVLMALGGVFAGGCTVGAGLSGIATLSLAAVAALLAIITGAFITARVDESLK